MTISREPRHIYTRTRYAGRVVNARTKAMLEAAAGIFGRPFALTQGSYNKGGVSASAGTHDGGGVVDISVSGMSPKERASAVQALRRAGFFAWLRTPPKFAYHIHAVAIGDRELSSSARRQVAQGFADRDGLAGGGPDPAADPYPAWVGRYGTHTSPDVPPTGKQWIHTDGAGIVQGFVGYANPTVIATPAGDSQPLAGKAPYILDVRVVRGRREWFVTDHTGNVVAFAPFGTPAVLRNAYGDSQPIAGPAPYTINVRTT